MSCSCSDLDVRISVVLLCRFRGCNGKGEAIKVGALKKNHTLASEFMFQSSWISVEEYFEESYI